MAYSNEVIDHYENPRNVGTLDKNDAQVGTGLVGAPACGDVMQLQIKVDKDDVIEDVLFKTFGCGSAIASSSLATEWLKGKTLNEAKEIRNDHIAKQLALPPIKLHCSILAEDAIKAAIADFRDKQKQLLLVDPEEECMISVTAQAAQHIKKELEKRGHGKGIKVGTKKSGCSGMAYTLEFADESSENDRIFETNGISIFVNPKDYVYLKGAELDFVKEGLNEGLQFNNPNESTKCGCGESFNI